MKLHSALNAWFLKNVVFKKYLQCRSSNTKSSFQLYFGHFPEFHMGAPNSFGSKKNRKNDQNFTDFFSERWNIKRVQGPSFIKKVFTEPILASTVTLKMSTGRPPTKMFGKWEFFIESSSKKIFEVGEAQKKLTILGLFSNILWNFEQLGKTLFFGTSFISKNQRSGGYFCARPPIFFQQNWLM